VPTVRRSDATSMVLDLARRLAEEFDSVPLPMVSRAVRAAADAARLFGDEVVESLATIERIAREDLTTIRDLALETDQELAAAG
jgi:hypothetical protein